MPHRFTELAQVAGIHIMGSQPQFQMDNVAYNFNLAMDAQPAMVTVSNSGIPAFLSTYIDPKLIEVLVSPMKAAEIIGSEVKKGDWTTQTTMFPLVESVGETSAYGDYSNSGQAGANTNFPQRQSFHYQVVTQWGEKELEIAGLAKIDWANRLNIASVLTLNKYQNKTYFFGVDGLQNYGLLNDPALETPVSPTEKAAATDVWSTATALEVYEDIKKLFSTLQTQANGLVELDTVMTLAMSPNSQVHLTKSSEFNVSVMDLVKKNFPNIRIEVAPEYATGSGELLQLIADELEGQRTVDAAFTEKMRAHPVKIDLSSFAQKKSQGTWGSVIFRPFLIAQMLGV